MNIADTGLPIVENNIRRPDVFPRHANVLDAVVQGGLPQQKRVVPLHDQFGVYRHHLVFLVLKIRRIVGFAVSTVFS